MQGYPPPGGYGPPAGPPGYGAPPGGYGPPPGGYGPPPGGGFTPPPGGGFGGPPNPSKAQGMVSGPAIGLIVTAIIGILWQLVSFLMNLLGTGIGAMATAGGDSSGVGSLFSGVVGLVFNVIWFLMGGLVIFGAIKMKNLQSYSLAMAASVVAALPCTSPCCFLGLPIGIWAIVMLMNQEVKGSFTG